MHVLGPHTKDLSRDWEYMMDLSIGQLYLTQENCFEPWVQNRCCSFVVFGFGWSWRVYGLMDLQTIIPKLFISLLDSKFVLTHESRISLDWKFQSSPT